MSAVCIPAQQSVTISTPPPTHLCPTLEHSASVKLLLHALPAVAPDTRAFGVRRVPAVARVALLLPRRVHARQPLALFLLAQRTGHARLAARVVGGKLEKVSSGLAQARIGVVIPAQHGGGCVCYT